jgi:hypothetical protein
MYERVDNRWDTYERIVKYGEGFVLCTPVLSEMSNDDGYNDFKLLFR